MLAASARDPGTDFESALGPHQGHGQAADLLGREVAINQQVQVHQIGLALLMALLQFGALLSGWDDEEVLREIVAWKLLDDLARYPLHVRLKGSCKHEQLLRNREQSKSNVLGRRINQPPGINK